MTILVAPDKIAAARAALEHSAPEAAQASESPIIGDGKRGFCSAQGCVEWSLYDSCARCGATGVCAKHAEAHSCPAPEAPAGTNLEDREARNTNKPSPTAEDAFSKGRPRPAGSRRTPQGNSDSDAGNVAEPQVRSGGSPESATLSSVSPSARAALGHKP